MSGNAIIILEGRSRVCLSDVKACLLHYTTNLDEEVVSFDATYAHNWQTDIASLKYK